MGLGQHNLKLISYIGPEGKLVYSHTSPCRLRIWDHLGVDLVHGRVVAHTGEIDVDLKGCQVEDRWILDGFFTLSRLCSVQPAASRTVVMFSSACLWECIT